MLCSAVPTDPLGTMCVPQPRGDMDQLQPPLPSFFLNTRGDRCPPPTSGWLHPTQSPLPNPCELLGSGGGGCRCFNAVASPEWHTSFSISDAAFLHMGAVWASLLALKSLVPPCLPPAHASAW